MELRQGNGAQRGLSVSGTCCSSVLDTRTQELSFSKFRPGFPPPPLSSAQSSFLLFFSSSKAPSDPALDGPSYLRHPFPILLRNFLLPVSSQSYVPFMLDATD